MRAEPYLLVFFVISTGTVHTYPDIFKTAYFFTQIRVHGILKQLWRGFKKMRFRWADSQVSCDGWKIDSFEYMYGFKNNRILVDMAVIHFSSLLKRLRKRLQQNLVYYNQF